MIFHQKKISSFHLLADHSHEISYLIFFELEKMLSQNLSSAAVVIRALRVFYIPLASSLSLCTVSPRVSFSSNSFSKNAFLSMACR